MEKIPYLFVSYAHDDADAVYPEVERARELNIRTWYDEGIHAGSSWREELAEKIYGCALFVFFVSPRSVESQNCIREVNYALECERPVIAIHLEETELPKGLHMALADRQAILKYRLTTREYLEKLQDGVETIIGEIASLQHSDASASPAIGRRLIAGSAVLFGIALIAAIVMMARHPSPDDSPEAAAPSPPTSQPNNDQAVAPQVDDENIAIAVLPFVNMSSDPDNEYFSDGISEQILDALVKTRTLDVIARTSSFQFKGKNVNVQEIGTTLNVSHVLEGSVRKAGNQVRITAQLIEAATGVHLWSDSFDRKLVDIFAVQDEIAEAIVTEINTRLGDDPWHLEYLKTRGVKVSSGRGVHPAAYELYLRALDNFATSTSLVEYMRSMDLLKEAVELDPDFADAWLQIAGLEWGQIDRANRDNARLARPALERALAIDPDHPRALSLMGMIQGFAELRWQEAETMVRRAVELAPSDAALRTSLGVLLGMTNRRLESLREHEQAYRLDPLNTSVVLNYADRLMWAARHEDAARVSATVDGLVRQSTSVHQIVDFYLRLGALEKARRHLDVLTEQRGADSARVRTRERWLADLEGDSARVAVLDRELWARIERGEYVPAFSWGNDRMVERLLMGVADREYETAFVLLAFIGNAGGELLEQMNLGAFDVRPIHIASASEKAETEKRRIQLPQALLDTYSGLYIDEDSGWVHHFWRDGDALMFDVPGDNYRGEAIPLADNHFINECCVVWEYRFNRDDRGRYYMVLYANQRPGGSRAWQSIRLTAQEMQKHAGVFRSNGAEVTVTVQDGRLIGKSPEGAAPLHAIDKGLFVGELAGIKVRYSADLTQLELISDGKVSQFKRI